MRRVTEDRTIERNYQQKWQFLIADYLRVKRREHERFKFVSDFFRFHNVTRQTFNKYYQRYAQSGDAIDLLPRKRGPRWQSRRTDAVIEARVLAERQNGLSRHDIFAVLKPDLGDKTPAPATIYKILRRGGQNRLQVKQKMNKQKIIKEKAGELGHLDCHYLSKDLLVEDTKRYYLVCLIDDATRLAWAEVVPDIKSLTVMFALLKCINVLAQDYAIRFEAVLTDNGSEVASAKNKDNHPVERLLSELQIKHYKTKPYRPQTNGKVERFWRTLNEDLIDFTTFDNLQTFKTELQQYLLYYNHLRPHQGINSLTPAQHHAKNTPTT